MINLRDLGYEKIDKVTKGISDYVSSKMSQLTNIGENFTPESLILNPKLNIDETTQLTFLNDVYIDRSISINKAKSGATVDHTLDNNSIISETKIKNPFEITLNCKLTGVDHKEKLKKIENFYEDTSSLCVLSFDGEVYNNLVITSLSQPISNTLYSELEISLKEYKFVEIKTVPAPEAKKATNKGQTKKAGKLDTAKKLPEKSEYEKGMEKLKDHSENYGSITNRATQAYHLEINTPLNVTEILLERMGK